KPCKMFYTRSIKIQKLGRSFISRTNRNFNQSSIRAGSHQLVKDLPYDRSKIYSVIVDVKSYPEFIPYCLSTKIIEPNQDDHEHHHQDKSDLRQLSITQPDSTSDEFDVLTRIGYKGFETDYYSRVICDPFNSVRVIARPSSTFTNLTTTWKLSPSSIGTNNESTQVQLDLSFKFKNPIHEFLLTDQLIWDKFSTLVIKSFEDRLSSLN
ncbi:hypothetical protein PSTT_13143, partial [Puccinia striiformis]